MVDIAAVVSLCAWLALALASHRFPQVPIVLYIVVMATAWASTLTAIRAAHRVPSPSLVPRVWCWAAVFRLVGCVAQPVLEDDYFRYLWDGWVFAQTGSPYATVPADYFENPNVPDALLPILNGINHPDIPTIYGPVAEWAFRLSYVVSPGSLWPWKLMLVGSELLTLRLLLSLVSPARALLFAWCPLLIQETAFSAHPEALGVVAMVAAMVWSAQGKLRGAAIGFALAAGVKPLGALVAPLALGYRQRAPWVVFGATIAVLWGPFVVDGTLSEWAGLLAFAQQWEFNSSIFGILSALAGQDVARALSLVAMVAGYVTLTRVMWTTDPIRDRPQVVPRGDWIYGGLLLLSPVVNPWYLAWLVPFVVCRPSRAGIAALTVASLSYFHGLSTGEISMGLYGHPVWVRPLEYGIVLVAGLSELRFFQSTRRWRRGVGGRDQPTRPYLARSSSRGNRSVFNMSGAGGADGRGLG